MKPRQLLHRNLSTIILLAALIVPFTDSHAAVWTNWFGNMRWGTAANWSPNTFPNANGAVADFQVDVPFNAVIQNVANGGGNLTPLLTTLKLGDTNGTQSITINKGSPAATTSRLHFTNSTGNTRIEKRGDGNDVIEVGSVRIYNSQLDIAFMGGLGTLRIGCDFAEQAPYVSKVNVTGNGTLILDANSTYTGGTIINGATVQFAGDQRFGSAPASLEPANITIINGGGLRVSGNSVNISTNRGVLLKGSGDIRFATADVGQTLTINSPISSEPGDAPSALVIAGPGNFNFVSGPNSYTCPTILTGGTLSLIAANQTGGGDLSVSNDTILTLNTSDNGTLNVPNFTLGNGGNVTLNINCGTLPGANPSNPGVNVSGSFVPGAASIVLNVSGSGFVAGQFTLIDYAGSPLANIDNFSLGSLPPGVVATLVHNEGNTSIDLNVSLVVNAVTWYGSVNNLWDIATTPNWNGGAATYNEYGVAGDAVTFDDTLDSTALNYNVDVTTDVKPAMVTVASENSGYTFSGSGKWTGGTILSKTGSQPLTILTANDYTGGSTIQSGIVHVGHNSALGSGLISLTGGGVASDSASPRTLANPLRITGATPLGDSVKNGTVTFSGNINFNGAGRDLTLHSDVTLTGTVTNGGLDQKMGPGTLRLNGVTGEFSNGQVQIEQGSVIINGGTLAKTGGGIRVVCMQPEGNSNLEITGGAVVTVTTTGANLRIGSPSTPISDPTATNIVDLSGSLIWATNNVNGGIVQMGGSCAFAQLNLNAGGYLKPVSFIHEGNTTELNFNGGTLAPLNNHGAFLQGLSAAYVRSGGANIDTAGKEITIAQSLLDGSGGGGLTKSGLGKVTLTGANTYTGNTVVNAGTLIVGPGHAGSGNILVSSGATAGYLSTGPGQTVSVPSTTVASGGALQVEFNGYSGNPALPVAAVGTLTLNGTVAVSVAAGGLTVGTIPLIAYTTLAGGGSVVTGQLPLGVVGTIVNNTGTKTIELVVSSVTPLLWTAAVNNTWNVNGTQNWSFESAPAVFNNGDTVLLGDSAANPFVAVAEAVVPGTIIVSNNALAYTISTLSTGKVTGSASLLKQGTNVLSINGTHDYNGNVTIANGTVVTLTAAALGSTNGITTVQSGGTLDAAGQDLRNEQIVVSGAGYNGKGALISSGALQNCMRHITLAGDTTFGGVNGIQWGFHSTIAVGATFNGNGFKITKVGQGDVLLKDLGETYIGDIEIVETTLSFQQSTTMGDSTKTCTIQPAGILAVRERASPLDKIIVINGGQIRDTHASVPSEFIGPITLNGMCTFANTPSMSLLAPVGGPGGFTKISAGTLVLGAANTYAGSTIISNGTVQLSPTGSIVSSNIFVNTGATFDVWYTGGLTLGADQTLSGMGTVIGSVTANGTVAPGASIGTLTFNENLTLNGTTIMEITRDGGLSSDRLQVTGSVVYGGVLQVVLTGSTPLSVNDTFDLVDAGGLSGGFSNMILPSGYSWDTTQLAVDGTIRVTAVASAGPTFGAPIFDGSNLGLSGTGGTPGASYRVLSSTNVALPVVNWEPVATNVFDGSGNFTFSAPVSGGEPHRFYLISVP